MTIDDVALRVAEALGATGVPLMLVGGFSSNLHGIPRSTKDADFVVQLSAPLNDAFARTLGPEFEVSSWTDHDEIMGIRHKTWPLEGVQYHPESFLTEQGERLLANFLKK